MLYQKGEYERENRYLYLLSQRHIEHHHKCKAYGKGDGRSVGVMTIVRLGDKFLDHNIYHRTCGKGEHIWEYALEILFAENCENSGYWFYQTR